MSRFQLTPACYLILKKDNQILLLRRCNTGYEDGNYSVVAGHLDGDETFRQAMVREAKEEAGIILDQEKLQVAHVMHRSKKDNNSERIDIFLIADEWNGEITNMEPDKCDDLNWFSINQLPENIIPYIKQALECIDNKIFYSEFGF